MKKKKKISNKVWIWIGLLAILSSAPNGTVIKNIYNDVSSSTFIVLKFGLMLVAFLPFLISFAVKHKKILRKNIIPLLVSATCSGLSVITFYKAIEISTASYASVIALLSPIVLVIVSSHLIRERVHSRAIAGIALAAVGGTLVVAIPAFLHGSVGSIFYPMATVLVLINCLAYPLSVVLQRKVNEQGVTISVYAAMTAVVTIFMALGVAMFNDGGLAKIVSEASNLSLNGWLSVFYTCFIVTFLSRSLYVISYERVGVAAASGLSYLQSLLSIVLPMLILGEQLSAELMLGAVLIMMGIYLAESRPHGGNKTKIHTNHHYLFHRAKLR